ncbi:MAG: PepSY domain-containing protein [Pseudomonadales bacterium]|nr:PepSY domain-containing protein [Pseudomonadales bacterium]
MTRVFVFWMHLVAGVAAGMVVLMMSVTGVLLAYERQVLDWADDIHFKLVPRGERLSIDELLASAPDLAVDALILPRDPGMPVRLRAGRSDAAALDPYTGEVLAPRGETLDEFFRAVEHWHRWFDLGENRNVGRALTGAANLLFLFLIASGLYLWLPALLRSDLFRQRLWFTGARTPAARDFNWHHVYGFWMALPLIVIVSSGVVMSYGWANALVYQAFGDTPPTRRGPPGDRSAREQSAWPANIESSFRDAASAVQTKVGDDWRTVQVSRGANGLEFVFDQGNGRQPQLRHTVTVRPDHSIVGIESLRDATPGRQARMWLRFLHTGEALGAWGQALAALASAAAVLMVWTGLSLAYRRHVRFRRRRERIKRTERTEPSGIEEQGV